MSRADNQWATRFDWRFELGNIYDGMENDMALPVGQVLPWYVFDPASTSVDPLYDVGSADGGGRRWKQPVHLQVVSAVKLEGSSDANDQGRYTSDTIRLVFSADHARSAGLGDLIVNPNIHVTDRLVYENKVFTPTQVRVRGMISNGYTTVAVDAVQVKREELVNDPQFRNYIGLDKT